MPIIFLLVSYLSHAHVIQDDVFASEKIRFNLKTVCQKMVSHESNLIEVVSANEIDCMGKKVEITKFCDQEMAANPYYIRSYVDRTTKEVVCQEGKKVLFKYLCTKVKDAEYCEIDARESCLNIKKKLAKSLDLVHSSFTKNPKGIKQLNCYFESLPLLEKTDGKP